MKKLTIFLIVIIVILLVIDLFTTNYLKEFYYRTTGKVVENKIQVGIYGGWYLGTVDEQCLRKLPEGCVFIRAKYERIGSPNDSSFLPMAYAKLVTDTNYKEYICYYGCPK